MPFISAKNRRYTLHSLQTSLAIKLQTITQHIPRMKRAFSLARTLPTKQFHLTTPLISLSARLRTFTSTPRTMSEEQDHSNWTQDPHPLLLIPGPIEFANSVLLSNAHPSMSHVSPAFSPVFGNCIKLLRKVLYTKDGQPILVAGSGTLGWDAVAANLVERGEKAVSDGPD